jgi:hypothetical protein
MVLLATWASASPLRAQRRRTRRSDDRRACLQCRATKPAPIIPIFSMATFTRRQISESASAGPGRGALAGGLMIADSATKCKNQFTACASLFIVGAVRGPQAPERLGPLRHGGQRLGVLQSGRHVFRDAGRILDPLSAVPQPPGYAHWGPPGGECRAAAEPVRPQSPIPAVCLGRRPGLPLHQAHRFAAPIAVQSQE